MLAVEPQQQLVAGEEQGHGGGVQALADEGAADHRAHRPRVQVARRAVHFDRDLVRHGSRVQAAAIARRECDWRRLDGLRRAALLHWPGGDGRVPRPAHGVSVSQEVLYRKWRPGGFADVAGQDPITTTLRNAVAAGSPAHAYLFTGPRGTGKTSTGRILAKAVNCQAPREGEPDNACTSCLAFNEGRALDLIELDAASNRGIDEVRALRESVGYAPNAGTYKVYLVDEVHMLTDAAFNALLKTLEEPPAHVIFVLATTEPHRIPPTISSRCQRFDFRRASLPALVERIGVIAEGEGISVAEGGPELIARQAGGSFRDAVNLLDQLAAYHGSELDLEAVQRGLGLVVDDRATALARAAVSRDLPAGLALLASVRDDGIEVRAFVREVVQTLRTLLLLRAGAQEELGLSDAQLSEMRPIAEETQAADIVAALRALGEIDFAGDAYDALPAEIAFASLAVGLPAEGDALATPEAAPQPVQAAQQPPAQARREAAPRRERAPRQPRGGQQPAAPRGPRPPQPRAEPAPAAAQRATTPARRGPPPPVLPEGEDASPELAALRERHAEIRDGARTAHQTAGALLNSRCYIKSFEGDTVEIGFQSKFLVEKALGDPAVLDAMRAAVGGVAGREVKVVPVGWEALQGAAPPRGPAAPARAGGGAAPT
ncbi:MAG: DNA polymerase III subunit gamma/tau, partial [Chloroflexi bacterium]|nr:DNA polymerase III subunit gamma/tau [Chloroflexota bacterium]